MEKELTNLLLKPASYYQKLILKNNPKFDFRKPVILFGAAKMGVIYAELCRKNNVIVVAFCDNDIKKGNTYLGNLLIINPATLKTYFKNNIQIIITSLYDQEIKKQLNNLGFKNVWSHTYFSTLFASNFSVLSWTNYINNINNNKKDITKVFNSLEDNLSKQTFMGILKYRLTLDRKYLKKIVRDLRNVYFDKSIIKLKNNEVFLDGGAYDGDTIKLLVTATKNKFKKALCFEPDFYSYSLLKTYVKKQLRDSRIKTFSYGLGEYEEILHFTDEGNLQSKVSKFGEREIKAFPIDKFINHKFTFIKLDIEGYEKEALSGAKKTIKQDMPKLAICAYHYQEDLWKIPLLIKKLNPKYKIYLRHYNEFLFDTICYAI